MKNPFGRIGKKEVREVERKESVKFKVQADLALFLAIQKDGKLSHEEIAKQTGIPASTVHYAMERIRRRNFFEIKAVPRLEQFAEIPMAIIGFSHVHPVKIKQLKDGYAKKGEIVQFFHSDKDVVLYVMDTSMEALTQRLFDIMEQLGEKPSIYAPSPVIGKYEVAIPEKVLEGVYGQLPGRRIKR